MNINELLNFNFTGIDQIFGYLDKNDLLKCRNVNKIFNKKVECHLYVNRKLQEVVLNLDEAKKIIDSMKTQIINDDSPNKKFDLENRIKILEEKYNISFCLFLKEYGEKVTENKLIDLFGGKRNFEALPELEFEDRMLSGNELTISLTDLSAPIMRGVDKQQRRFFVIRAKDNYGKTKCQAFFEHTSNYISHFGSVQYRRTVWAHSGGSKIIKLYNDKLINPEEKNHEEYTKLQTLINTGKLYNELLHSIEFILQ